jgi:hypothetical protein
MDLDFMLRELRDELERIDEAMRALEKIASIKRRRGRPPKWLTAFKGERTLPAVQRDDQPALEVQQRSRKIERKEPGKEGDQVSGKKQHA